MHLNFPKNRLGMVSMDCIGIKFTLDKFRIRWIDVLYILIGVSEILWKIVLISRASLERLCIFRSVIVEKSKAI